MNRPDPNSPLPDLVAPNPEPLTGKELIEDRFEHVAAINRDEDALAALRESIINARTDALSRNDLERADNELAAHASERSQKPSKKIEERTDKQRETLKAERKAIEANYERQMAITPGPARNHLREFYNSSAVHAKYVHAETPTDIREGESALDANTRLIAEFRELLPQKKAVTRAHLPAETVIHNAQAFVHRAGDKASLGELISGLRNVSFDARWGFTHKSPSVPDGNAFAILCALMPDQVAAALAARALAGHSEANALDDVTRAEKLAAIDARILEIQYATEANHRYARKRGESAGMRISSNPLAILDLKEA